MPPRISVALGTYNGAKHLQAQLDSLASQETLPFELVVSDDGSTDDTLKILERFAAVAPFPVQIAINPRNLGFAENFLKTAGRCNGDWIAFCDQDDVWFPSKIRIVSAAIETHPNDDLVLVAHRLLLTDEELRPAGERTKFFHWQGTRTFGKRCAPGLWSLGGCQMIVRRDLVHGVPNDVRPFNELSWINLGRPRDRKVAHDRWYSMLANALGQSLLLDDSLAFFRRHASTSTGSHESPTLAESFSSIRAAGQDHYRLEAESCVAAAACFRQLEKEALPTFTRDLLVAAKAYGDLEQAYRWRSAIHAPPVTEKLARNRAYRAKLLLRGLKKGHYRSRGFCGLGWRAFIKDFAAVLFVPKKIAC